MRLLVNSPCRSALTRRSRSLSGTKPERLLLSDKPKLLRVFILSIASYQLPAIAFCASAMVIISVIGSSGDEMKPHFS